MRHDLRKYLWDIDRACDDVLSYCANKSLPLYLQDGMLRTAVERKLGIIGEAMGKEVKLDVTIQTAISDTDKIITFRHVIVHDYDRIKDETVWRSSPRM